MEETPMAASTSSSGSLSKSALVRARLKHPVIDSDGHTVEFQPALRDYIRQVAGPDLAGRYRSDGANWYRMSWDQRRAERPLRPPWWALPTKNTLDRATATFPKLLHERLDQTGIDFAVLYPTAGLGAPHIREDELRRATCRSFNTYHADIFREYSDRLTPAAIIPMHTPREAIEELEHAVKTLGLKVIMMAGHVRRPIPAIAAAVPHPTRYAYWLDLFALDSEYDYDPVWAKCIELGVAPSFHSPGMGWGSRGSISNYMFNHIGHFASAGEALCKAMFFGGVTRRFPQLRCAFLECGVGWAASLYADMIGHWQKRNGKAMENYNPANLDRELFQDLARRYGGKLVTDRLDGHGAGWGIGGTEEDPAALDDWSRCGIKTSEDNPRPVRSPLLLRLRGRRSDQRHGVRYAQASLRRSPQRHLQFGYRPLGRARYDRGDRGSLRDGRARTYRRRGLPRFRLRQSGPAMDQLEPPLLRRHGGRSGRERAPQWALK
jgi:predicted TIM-barrel fold metal-dependent hydrolase